VPDLFPRRSSSGGSAPAIGKLDAFVESNGLVGKVEADHISHKCQSAESFERIRKAFEHDSKWIYQSIISQRRISLIRFEPGLRTSVGPIGLLELSDQKPDMSQKDGFDHVEVYPVGIDYGQLVWDLGKRGLEVKEVVRPHHTTHDITLDDGFIVRLTRSRLAEKVRREEMS
jgi:hypothetical protein